MYEILGQTAQEMHAAWMQVHAFRISDGVQKRTVKENLFKGHDLVRKFNLYGNSDMSFAIYIWA